MLNQKHDIISQTCLMKLKIKVNQLDIREHKEMSGATCLAYCALNVAVG
jgi:hypothetical protein